MGGEFRLPEKEFDRFGEQVEQTIKKTPTELPKITATKPALAEQRTDAVKHVTFDAATRAKEMIEEQLGARLQQSLGQTEARLTKSKGEDTERYQQVKAVLESASQNLQQGNLEQASKLTQESMVLLALADMIAESRVKKEAPKMQEYLKAAWDATAISHDLASSSNYANAALVYSKLNAEDKQKLEIALQAPAEASGLLIVILDKKAENYASKTVAQDFDRAFEYLSKGYFEEAQKAYDFANLKAGIKQPAKIAQEEPAVKAYFAIVDEAVKAGKTVQEYAEGKGTNLQEMESKFAEANRKMKTATFEQELTGFQGGVYAPYVIKAREYYKEYLADGNKMNEACAYAYLDTLNCMKSALAAKAGKVIPNIEAAFAKIDEAALTNKSEVLNDAYLELRHSGIALQKKKTEAAIERNVQLISQQNQKLGRELRVTTSEKLDATHPEAKMLTKGGSLVYDASVFQRRLEHALADLRAGKTEEAVRELKDITSEMAKKEAIARKLKSVDALEQSVGQIYQYYEGVMRVSKSLTGVPGLSKVGGDLTIQARDARIWISRDFAALRQEILAGRTGKIPEELQDSLERVARGELPRSAFNQYAEGLAAKGTIKSGDLKFVKRVAEVQEAQFELRKRQRYIEVATYGMKEYAKLQAIISKIKEERSGDMGMGVRIGNLQSAAAKFLELAQAATRDMKEGGEFNAAKYVPLQATAVKMKYCAMSDFAHKGNERHGIWERIIAFEKGVFAARISDNLSTSDPESKKKMDQGLRLAQQQIDVIVGSTISLKSITTTEAQAEMFNAANPILAAYMGAITYAVNGRNAEAKSLLQQGLSQASTFNSAYSSAYSTQIWTEFAQETGVNIAAVVNPEFAIAYQVGNLLETYSATGKMDYVNLAFAAGAMILRATPALTEAERLVGKLAIAQKVARGIEFGVGTAMTVGGIAVAGYEMHQTGLTYESGANFASNVVDALVGGAHGAMRLRHALKYQRSWLEHDTQLREGFTRLREKGAERLDTLRVKLREIRLDETGAVGPGVAELSVRNVARKALQEIDTVWKRSQDRVQKGDVKGAIKLYDDAIITARAAYNKTKDDAFLEDLGYLRHEREELARGVTGPAEKKRPELRLIKTEPEHTQLPEEGPMLAVGLRGKEKEVVEARASEATALATEGKYAEALEAYNSAISFAESAYRGTKKDEFIAKREALIYERDALVGYMKGKGIPIPSKKIDLTAPGRTRTETRVETVHDNPETYVREVPAYQEPRRERLMKEFYGKPVNEQQAIDVIVRMGEFVAKGGNIGTFPEYKLYESIVLKLMKQPEMQKRTYEKANSILSERLDSAELKNAKREQRRTVLDMNFLGGEYRPITEVLESINTTLPKSEETFPKESELGRLRQKVLERGTQEQLAAQGISLDKGGLTSLASIVIDGEINRGGLAPLSTFNNPAHSAGPHGPYYVVVEESPKIKTKTRGEGFAMDSVVPEELHKAYIVPSEVAKRKLKEVIDEGIRLGILTKSEAANVFSKVYTYKEFIEAPAGEFRARTPKVDEGKSAQAEAYFKSTVYDARLLLKERKLADALMKYDEAIDLAHEMGNEKLKTTLEKERRELEADMVEKGVMPDQDFGPARERKKPVESKVEEAPEEPIMRIGEEDIRGDDEVKVPEETQAERLRKMREAAERRKAKREKPIEETHLEEQIDISEEIDGSTLKATDIPNARHLEKERQMTEQAKQLEEARTKALQGSRYEELGSKLGSSEATAIIRAVISTDMSAPILKGKGNPQLTKKELYEFEHMDPRKRAERVGEALNRIYKDTPDTVSARHSKETKVTPDSPRRQAFNTVKEIEAKLGMQLVDENAVLLHEPNILRIDIGGEVHQRAREKIEDVAQSPLYPVFTDKLKAYVRDPSSRDPDLKLIDYRVLAVLSDHQAIDLAVRGAAAEFGGPKVRGINKISYLGAGCFNAAFKIDVTFVDGTTGSFVLRGPSDPRADYAAYAMMKAVGTKAPASSKAYEAVDTEGGKIQISIQEFVKGESIDTAIKRITTDMLPGPERREALEKITASYFDNMATASFYGLLDNHEGNFVVNPDLTITRMDYGVHSLQKGNARIINEMASEFTQTLLPRWSEGTFTFDNGLQKVAFEAFKKRWETLQQKKGEVHQKMQELVDAGQLFSGNGGDHDAVEFYANGKVRSEHGLSILGESAIKQFDEFAARSPEDVYGDFKSAEAEYIEQLKEAIKKQQQNSPPPQPQQAASKKTPGAKPGKI